MSFSLGLGSLWHYSSAAPDNDRFLLVPARSSGVDLVKIAMEARGELRGDGKTEPRKAVMTAHAQSVYEERRYASNPKLGIQEPAARWYEMAKVHITVGSITEEVELKPEQRQIHALFNEKRGRFEFYAPFTRLSRRELDLMRIPCHSLVIEGVLSGEEQAEGDEWAVDPKAVARLFELDEATDCAVRAKLTSVDQGLAKIHLRGSTMGRIDGALTQIKLTGEVRFDVQTRRLRWAQIKFQEDRAAGFAAPAVQAVAELRMLIEPQTGNAGLSNKARLPDEFPVPKKSDLWLRYVSSESGFEFHHERTWYIVSDERKQVTLRLPTTRVVLAQCNLSRLPNLPAGKELSLEAFQRDIEKALGDRFSEFGEATQSRRGDGAKILRVVARGIVEQAPVRWIYIHLQDSAGQRASFVFTMAEDKAEQFGNRDMLLVDSFKFTGPPSEEVARKQEK